MQVEFFKGNLANLPATGTPFAWYVVEDTQQIYRADANGLIKLYSDIVVVGELPASGVANKLYIDSTNTLSIFLNGSWVGLGGGSGGDNTTPHWTTATPYPAGTLVVHQKGIYYVKVAHTSGVLATDVKNGKLNPIVASETVSTTFSYDSEERITRIETTGDENSITVFTYVGENMTQSVLTTPLYITTTTLSYDAQENITGITTTTQERG